MKLMALINDADNVNKVDDQVDIMSYNFWLGSGQTLLS